MISGDQQFELTKVYIRQNEKDFTVWFFLDRYRARTINVEIKCKDLKESEILQKQFLEKKWLNAEDYIHHQTFEKNYCVGFERLRAFTGFQI